MRTARVWFIRSEERRVGKERCARCWRHCLLSSVRNHTSSMCAFSARVFLSLPLGISISKPGLISRRFSTEFSSHAKYQRFHRRSRTDHVAARPMNAHCQGVVHQIGRASCRERAMCEVLASLFALQRSQSYEFDVCLQCSSISLLAPRDQHFKAGTHLPPFFHRVFITREVPAISPTVTHGPCGWSADECALPGCGSSDRKSVV